MKESYSYEQLEDRRVRCITCESRCFILPNRFGSCGVRKNIDGKLYALNYGKVIALNIDPIEKKPLFHFIPGTESLSFGTVGCNLHCGNCQNWQISQGVKSDEVLLDAGKNLDPEQIVDLAIEKNCPSISYTYTEPTIFLEFALDTMKIAKRKKLKNIWVSNGFMTDETLDLVLPYLDAANIDIKSFDDDFYKKHCGAKVGPILRNCERIKKSGAWIEITSLIIPTLSDDEEMLKKVATFIFDKLGSETPWHLSAFSGAISWKMQDVPGTSAEKIHRLYNMGKNAGLKYVYAGNLFGDMEENTYCPVCGEINIKRLGYMISRYDEMGKCRKCGENLNLFG